MGKAAKSNGLFERLLMVSSDKGKNWTGLIRVVSKAHRESWGSE